MARGLSGLGGFMKGFTEGYKFTTNEMAKSQEREAAQYKLDEEAAQKKAFDEMPKFEEFRRPIYAEGQEPPKDFTGPPSPGQVEAYVHDADGYARALRKAADNIKDPTKRQVFTTAGMQNLFDNAQRFARDALVLKQSKQDDAAYKALQRAYAYMPDGQDVQFKRDEGSGAITSMRLLDRQGNVLQDDVPLPNEQQFRMFAFGMQDPKTYFTLYQQQQKIDMAKEEFDEQKKQFKLVYDQRKEFFYSKFLEEQYEFNQRYGLELDRYKLDLKKFGLDERIANATLKAAEAAHNKWVPKEQHAASKIAGESIDEWIKTNKLAEKMTNPANAAVQAKQIADALLWFNGPEKMTPALAAQIALSLVDETGQLRDGLGLHQDPKFPGYVRVGGKQGIVYNGGPQVMQFMLMEQAKKAPPAAPGAPGGAPQPTAPGIQVQGAGAASGPFAEQAPLRARIQDLQERLQQEGVSPQVRQGWQVELTGLLQQLQKGRGLDLGASAMVGSGSPGIQAPPPAPVQEAAGPPAPVAGMQPTQSEVRSPTQVAQGPGATVIAGKGMTLEGLLQYMIRSNASKEDIDAVRAAIEAANKVGGAQ